MGWTKTRLAYRPPRHGSPIALRFRNALGFARQFLGWSPDSSCAGRPPGLSHAARQLLVASKFSRWSPANSRVGRPPGLGPAARQFLGWSPANSRAGRPPVLGLVARQFLGWSPANSRAGRPPILELVARNFLGWSGRSATCSLVTRCVLRAIPGRPWPRAKKRTGYANYPGPLLQGLRWGHQAGPLCGGMRSPTTTATTTATTTTATANITTTTTTAAPTTTTPACPTAPTNPLPHTTSSHDRFPFCNLTEARDVLKTLRLTSRHMLTRARVTREAARASYKNIAHGQVATR